MHVLAKHRSRTLDLVEERFERRDVHAEQLPDEHPMTDGHAGIGEPRSARIGRRQLAAGFVGEVEGLPHISSPASA